MPPTVPPFADSTHATLSLLKPDTIIPRRTHITVIVGGIGGLPTNNTTATFRALLHCEVPNDGQAINDYVLPRDAGTSTCSFKIQFGYSAEQATRVDDAFGQVEIAREALAGLIKTKEPLTVDIGGARVLSFSRPERTWTAELDAFGQRSFALGDGQPRQLLPAMDSSPVWWPTPAPSTPPASEFVPSPDSSRDAEPSETHRASTRLRPITTLPVPHPPPAQPKNKSSVPKVPVSLPQHSSTSAQKRATSPLKQVSSAKRLRNSKGRDSSDIGPDAPFPPHNGFVEIQLAQPPELTGDLPDIPGETGLIVVQDKSRKISAPKKRIQLDAQPAGGIIHHDDDDVFGIHEGTRSEHLDGFLSPAAPKGPPDPSDDQSGHGTAFTVDIACTADLRNASRTTLHDSEALATNASLKDPAGENRPLSRTSTEGSDAFRFVTGRRQKEIESQRQIIGATQVQASRRDHEPHTPAPNHTVVLPKRTDEAVVGPSASASSRTRIDRFDRTRKEQQRLEAEAKVTELREMERERTAQQSASAFGLPVHLNGITYTPLAKLKNGEKRNIMGVVLEPPSAVKQVGGGDWVVTVVLVDPTSPGHERKLEGTPVTMFRAEDAQLPVVYPGMVMALCNIKAQFFKEKIKGNLYKPTKRETNSWAHMKKNGTTMTSSSDVALSEDELEHMRKLRDWWVAKSGSGADPSDAGEARTPTAGGGEGKTKALGSLVAGDFANITVRILYACTNTKGPGLELYVTDGTVNPLPTRNFRELQNGTPPSAIWTISIFDKLDNENAQHLQDDAFVVLRNVRAKAHSQTGELEMLWSERLAEWQVEKGWKPKPVTPVPRNDYRATQINQRINQLKKQWAENPAAFDNMPILPRSNDGNHLEHGQAVPAPRLSDHLATHVGTVHTDPVRNRISTLAEVKASKQAPNKWRFHARVMELRPRQSGRGENNYVVWYCARCDRRFDPPACQACTDAGLQHAELRYWIWAELENQGETMSIIIANEAAAEFLPPLPPLVASTNPNDKKKMDTRVREANRAVEDMLLGAKMDGQWSKPIIDWSVETVEQEIFHAGGWRRVVKHLAMGMKSK